MVREMLSLFLVLLVFLSAACQNSNALESRQPSLAQKPAEPKPSPTALTQNPNRPEGTPRSPASDVLELSGTAKPARTSGLSAKASGILRSMKVREGQWVQAGQVLCVLDPTDILLRTEAATIGQSQAQEGLTNAQNDLARVEQLFNAKAVSNTQLEKAQLALRIAKLQADSAEVGLKMAKQALADTSIRAPFPGIITRLLSEEGQMITTMPPTTLFILVDVDTLEVRVPVPERRLAQVKVGLPVVVQLPALGLERQAKVDRLTEVIDPATRAAEAIIRIDNRDRALPGGLYARVRFLTISADKDDSTKPSDFGSSASGQ